MVAFDEGKEESFGEAFNKARTEKGIGQSFVWEGKIFTTYFADEGKVKAEELMTICSCCPCCCLWGLVTDLTPKISHKITRMPGVQVEVTEDCTGCSLCADGTCFVEAILVENGRAEISLECRGCGRCVEICPEDAILLTIDGKQNIQEAINQLDVLMS